MTEEQMEEVFSEYGHDEMYRRFRTPLYVTGLFDEVEMDELEDFFENFELSPSIFFDEFRFWFQYFSVTLKDS
ncbi:hypothetical protein SAMN04487936_105113 [Halobacillus dabanensis]|uniref:Uncharacterized protein n=1 Tax=Halobacillus dabanensis TaxID=240302 RepID=A0A1I3V3K8_HALDA|nr:hypothetical protein [Halobacillus dabanensis]SFJ89702.1 hypothetical protein SAMN04487936_105113 [Halobacillus dabanensis]